MKTFTMLAVWVSAVLGAVVAEAATFKIHEYSNGNKYIQLSGPIAKGDIDRFTLLLFNNPEIPDGTILMLDSPGGSVTEGEGIEKVVKNRGFRTYVASDAKCYSMCANIWLTGALKYHGGRDNIGYHVASYADPKEMTEFLFKHGMLGVQKLVQRNFSWSIDKYVNQYGKELNDPYKFAFHVSSYGYTAEHFWKPTQAQLIELVKDYKYVGE